MSLDYTQKIERVLPLELWTERDIACLLTGCGLTPDLQINNVPLFVDPRTVAALLRSDEQIQDIYLESSGLKPWEDCRITTSKTELLRTKLREIITIDRADGYIEEERQAAVGMVLRIADDLTRGNARDANGYPIVGDPMARALMREDPGEDFDLEAALDSAVAQAREVERREAASLTSQAPTPAEPPRPH